MKDITLQSVRRLYLVCRLYLQIVAGIKENLGNGKWGYIVENRKETLYHAISRCFDEPGFLEELKKKSEAGSIQDTYEGRLKKIESIIEGVVN